MAGAIDQNCFFPLFFLPLFAFFCTWNDVCVKMSLTVSTLPSAELLDQRQEPKGKWYYQYFPPGQNGTTTSTELGRSPEVQDWLVCQQPLYSLQVCRCSQTFLTCQHQCPKYNNWARLLQLRPRDLGSGELLWFPFVFPGFPVPAGHVPVLE